MSVSGKKPVVGRVSSIRTPVIPVNLVGSNTWSFSFKYFKQIENFGLDRVPQKWFVSLLERLKELCDITKDEFDRQQHLRDNARYHVVTWTAKNCPIRRSDLVWVPKTYLDNEVEYPFYQFDVTKALGRIVGFWNETSTVFEIVLFDILHNIYPHKIVNYKVRPCFPLGSEFADLQYFVDTMHKQACKADNCGYRQKLQNPSVLREPHAMIVAYLEEDVFEEYEKVLATNSISDIITTGILALQSD